MSAAFMSDDILTGESQREVRLSRPGPTRTPRTKLGNTGPPYKRPRTEPTRAESPEIEQMEPTSSPAEQSAGETLVMEVMARTISDQAETIKGLQNEIKKQCFLLESMSVTEPTALRHSKRRSFSIMVPKPIKRVCRMKWLDYTEYYI